MPNPNCDIEWSDNNRQMCAEVTYHVHNFLLADLAELSIMIAMTNSLINPFIYAMCSTEFRAAIKHLFSLAKLAGKQNG